MEKDNRSLYERLRESRLTPLEEKLRGATSGAEISEIMRAERSGGTMTLTRNLDGTVSYSNALPTSPTEPQGTMPQTDDGMFRAVWQLPDGRMQLVEAYSASGLGVLERSLANWKGSRKIR
jgi:hypothetical protein